MIYIISINIGRETMDLIAQGTNLYQSSFSTDYSVDTTTSSGFFLFGGMWMLFWLVVAVIGIVAMWKVYVKAGKPGWAAIIPIYNIIVMLQIVGRPVWWIILLFIPIVNIVVQLIISLDMAKAFGKSDLFGVFGLWLFSIVGYLILGFGDAKYVGPLGSSPEAPTTGPSQPAQPSQQPPTVQ
jgi:hypothetical protein